jgi:hypothetical protein
MVARLPGTKALRLSVAAGIVLLQGWVVYNNDPWHWWGLGKWGDTPYFELELDEQARTQPATYVTVANISYSLVAHKFAQESRWVNISSLPDAGGGGAENARMQKLLAQSKSLKLFVPSRPEFMTNEMQPNPDLQAVINNMLIGQRLALAAPLDCRLLRSRGLARTALKDVDKTPVEQVDKIGFWVCTLAYPFPPPPSEKGGDPEVNAIFGLIEKQCPRFYQPGQTNAARVEGGWLRVYPQADIRLYVMDSGNVYYKYWRALNPELLGRTDELRAGKRADCTVIRGRSGLPWERGI